MLSPFLLYFFFHFLFYLLHKPGFSVQCFRCNVLGRVRLCAPRDCSHQSPLSMKCFRQEYWSGLPFPPLGDLPDPGIEAASLASPTLAGRFFTTVPPEKSTIFNRCGNNKLLIYYQKFPILKKILGFCFYLHLQPLQFQEGLC